MSNKKSNASFYVTIAFIILVVAAIIYVVVSGSNILPEKNVSDNENVENVNNTDTDDNADADADNNADADADIDADTDANTDAGTDANTDAGTDANTDADADANTDTEAGADDLNNDIYVYELEEDFISVKGIKDNNLSGKIIVPSDIDNVAVKIINPHTFLNTNVEEIVFMEGIEEISSFAISDCVNLKKVIIPASCKIIGGVSYMPAIEYCDNLETIEIYGEYESLPLFVADCPSLKNIVFYGDVINITNEFKYNFYKCEPRVKRVNPRVFTEALDITIKGKSGSNIEKFAKENGFNFISITDHNIKK